MNYFIKINGEEKGPLSAKQIRLRLAQKSLSASTMVRPVGGTAWETLDSVEDFRKPVKRHLDPKIAMILLVLLTLGVALSVSVYQSLKIRSDLAKGISNCRQIIVTMRLYSSDVNGGCMPDNYDPYPRPRSSNDAFRHMFMWGTARDEMIFGCPNSDFQPDGKFGKAPDFCEALEPGENHWAMTEGLNDSAAGTYPLVFENPTEATWPPKWNPDLAGTRKPGRTWPDGKVIIGINDGSVSLLPLGPPKGASVGSDSFPDAQWVFVRNIHSAGSPPPTVLNVAKKEEP